MSGEPPRTGNQTESSTAALAAVLHRIAQNAVEERVGGAIVGGRVNLNQSRGVTQPANTGFIDHDHSGEIRQGQKLSEANTHEDVTLGDDTGAIHWTEAALAALIAAHAAPLTRWEILTDGDPDDDQTELIFAGGDLIYVEVPL